MNTILYAEDDDNDVFLMQRTFEDLKILHPLRIVTDGKQALAYLGNTGVYTDRVAHPTPMLVLLDLSMPGKRGIEVLTWIRAQPNLTEMTVIVLTSSNQQTDIHRAYLLGANGYFVKPGDPDELLRIVKTVQERWLDYNPQRTPFHDVAAYRSPADGVISRPGAVEN